MSNMPKETLGKWVPDEFVVALRHLPAAMSALRELPRPVNAPVIKKSTALDLALLRIPNVEAVADALGGRIKAGEHAIDRVIRAIREHSRQRYGNWTPLMGKNRMLDGVHTAQHVGTGSAAKYPRRASREHLGDLAADGSADRPVVGIIDTPLWAHPDLEGRYRRDEPDVHLSPAGWHWHSAGHGTFVAALVLQNSPNIDVVVRKGLGADGTAVAWDIAEEMVKLARSVDVLNVSFSCFADDDEEPLLLARAVEMSGPDTVIVAAAGNFADRRQGDGRLGPLRPNSPMWPAASSRVVAVGAHDVDGSRAPFSPHVPWIDLSARGIDVPSLYLKGTVRFRRHRDDTPAAGEESFDGYASWSGTSFAAAMASGAIARRIRKGHDGVTALKAAERVRQLAPGNAEQVWGYQFFGGR